MIDFVSVMLSLTASYILDFWINKFKIQLKYVHKLRALN